MSRAESESHESLESREGDAEERQPLNCQIVQHVTRNGERLWQAQRLPNPKEELNADVTLPRELAEVQNTAYEMLAVFVAKPDPVRQLLDILQRYQENGIVPDNNDINWTAQLERFVVALRNAIDIRIREERERIEQLIIVLADKVEVVMACLEIKLKFSSKLKRAEFLERFMGKKLSQDIAAVVFDDNFRHRLSKTDDSLARDRSAQDKEAMQKFLKQVVKQMHIQITCSADQLISTKDEDGSSDFQFTISPTKLLYHSVCRDLFFSSSFFEIERAEQEGKKRLNKITDHWSILIKAVAHPIGEWVRPSSPSSASSHKAMMP